MPILDKLKKAFVPPDPKRALDAPPGVTRPHTYIDINIGPKPIGRIEFELFTDIVPLTAENFRQLSSDDNAFDSEVKGYRGSVFHRVIPGFMIQGGDVVHGDGTGVYSIYGGLFADEGFKIKHEISGLLSMANTGPNTNGCQFFITTAPADFLDGKHVVFGRVIKGMDVVRAIESTPTQNDRPVQPVIITHCGVHETTADHHGDDAGTGAAAGTAAGAAAGANAVPTSGDRAVGTDPALSATGTSAAPNAQNFEGTGAPVSIPHTQTQDQGFTGGSGLNKTPTHTDTSRGAVSDPNAPRGKMSVFADSGGDFADSSPVDRVRSNESTGSRKIATSPNQRLGVFASSGGDFADSQPVDRVRE